jgi:hypothetical protein
MTVADDGSRIEAIQCADDCYEPRCEIALEQSQGCVQAATATSWHVMLVLLPLKELLRQLELSRTLERRLRR